MRVRLTFVFVGRFGVANALPAAFPRVPPLVAYTGVRFPDVLWGALVLAGVAHVVQALDPTAPASEAGLGRQVAGRIQTEERAGVLPHQPWDEGHGLPLPQPARADQGP